MTWPADADQRPATDYAGVVRRQKWSIIVITLMAAGLALGVTLVRPRTYQATAQVVVRDGTSVAPSGAAASARPDPQRTLETEIRVLVGSDVRAAVRKDLGPVPPISASAVSGADIIAIRARSQQPSRAAQVANAYANAYIAQRTSEARDAALAITGQVQGQIDELQGQASRATGPAQAALVQAQAALRQQLGLVQVAASLSGASARLLAAAGPGSPVGPRPARTASWALSFGLALGLALAFFRDYLDTSVRTRADLARAVPGVPVVGLIPLVGQGEAGTGRRRRLPALDDPDSPASEAYRSLRTIIPLLGLAQPVRTIQITSPLPGEGKTTTVANLAVSMARAGFRVAVVCCDLRHPGLHQLFGLANDRGLTSVIVGREPLGPTLARVEGQPGLMVVTSGPRPPNPSEVLASEEAAEVLRSLRADADIVLLDSPPVLVVADSLILSAHVDATLVVCRAGQTTSLDLSRAVDALNKVAAPLAGTILNCGAGEPTYGHPDRIRPRSRADTGDTPRRSRRSEVPR